MILLLPEHFMQINPIQHLYSQTTDQIENLFNEAYTRLFCLQQFNRGIASHALFNRIIINQEFDKAANQLQLFESHHPITLNMLLAHAKILKKLDYVIISPVILKTIDEVDLLSEYLQTISKPVLFLGIQIQSKTIIKIFKKKLHHQNFYFGTIDSQTQKWLLDEGIRQTKQIGFLPSTYFLNPIKARSSNYFVVILKYITRINEEFIKTLESILNAKAVILVTDIKERIMLEKYLHSFSSTVVLYEKDAIFSLCQKAKCIITFRFTGELLACITGTPFMHIVNQDPFEPYYHDTDPQSLYHFYIKEPFSMELLRSQLQTLNQLDYQDLSTAIDSFHRTLDLWLKRIL